ncbi:dTDP-4-amino-4,6-dideoxygalactose transaminase [Aeromonas caviae]|uniref:dTDP-4-amino-4,6-dideoxygalactose transaminase n=1 Tax=Aeromonas TaxID=642 RepID=UPI0022E834E2|nr:MULTISPECIES: dTDP-4-amino-4,6-dideoxygalactose transaminase [Aeromonas]MEB5775831.1 dTDP-4-amino-4,6-dideoxygalactose transaminase [Aeromonas caviae]MEB6651057.1 dTDP-4-amino-4,6-dideoxygalactose transaminase [Aeromonas caviae]
MKSIPFNLPPIVGKELEYIDLAINSGRLCGDGHFTKKCQAWLEQNFNAPLSLLTPSCTASLEMAAILIDIQPGDEVIMPSYTFVSTANAFVLRGAKVVFVDIRPDTMNIDEKLIELAITNKTKAIVPVHYAGVGCDMDVIMTLAKKYNLWVIEDAAQGVMAKYKNKYLGTIGHIGCYSFHETKNYSSGGEGGAIIINDPALIERAEIIREKGTNRKAFLDGQVDKYTWRDVGSSFLLSDLQAAFLYAQLDKSVKINERRIALWKRYYNAFSGLNLPHIPIECQHNAHMFYIKLENKKSRSNFISKMKSAGITTPFHYVPLHSCEAGARFGRFFGEDVYTTRESERLVRLPLFYNISDDDIDLVIKEVLEALC